MQAAWRQAFAAVAPPGQKKLSDRGPAVDAVGAEDRLRIAGEQRGRLAPQAELHVLRERDLQALDGTDILGALNLQRQAGDFRRVVHGLRVSRQGESRCAQCERELAANPAMARHQGFLLTLASLRSPFPVSSLGTRYLTTPYFCARDSHSAWLISLADTSRGSRHLAASSNGPPLAFISFSAMYIAPMPMSSMW